MTKQIGFKLCGKKIKRFRPIKNSQWNKVFERDIDSTNSNYFEKNFEQILTIGFNKGEMCIYLWHGMMSFGLTLTEIETMTEYFKNNKEKIHKEIIAKEI